MTDKTFYLGIDPSGIYGNYTYNDGSPIQADLIGYPPVTVIIHEWQNVPATTKILIITQLTAQGYVEQ